MTRLRGAMEFRLNRTLDRAALRAAFETEGFVQVPEVLRESDALRVAGCLEQGTPWNLVCSDRGSHVDLSAEQWQAMGAEQRRQLEQAVYAQARDGFQYFYNNYPVCDAWRAGLNPGHLLHAFYEWLNGESFLRFARQVTGFDDIGFADAQATRYGPGHFLTAHDDASEGKNRRAAYVFNFTRHWRADWGGYLQLLDEAGGVRRGLRPVFNALNILKVPQRHNVSFVAPFAAAARYSITGWLRYGKDS